MEPTPKSRTNPVRTLAMGLACIMVIAIGIFGMKTLAASKRPPGEKPKKEGDLTVSAVPAEKQTIRLTAMGYGQAEPVNVLEICPQVSGNIVRRHPALEQGGMVSKGEVLLKIDDTDYAITVDKAVAEVKLSENAIAQYRMSYARDKDRLDAVRKTTQLGKAEYLRLKTLYESDRVGTLSEVETAEKNYNTYLDSEKSLIKTISLYPLQIEEAKSDLAQDKADLKTVKLNLERCVITAPFSGRVKAESVETGTYISTGTSALTLTDDNVVEIQVPLSDRDAFEVLGLRHTPGTNTWFSGLSAINCRIETITGKSFAAMAARVHRAVRYDETTRTLYLAVRVMQGSDMEKNGSAPGQGGIPLVEGMFCKVYFQGRPVPDVVKIPLNALNPDDTVFLARDNRLKTLAVTQVMAEGEDVYVSGEFEQGDSIITTPLNNPIENTRLVVRQARAAVQIARVSGGPK
ncbi:MAG: hypothetical protein MI863_04565 [Desulfobacterales bacterium]|nr:hypothetical protein [Desulfobacterales bacterium]